MEAATGHARFGGLLATRPAEVRHDVGAIESGFWVVVAEFEGAVTAVRFESVDRYAAPPPASPWSPLEGDWACHLSAALTSRPVRVRDRFSFSEE